MFKFLNGFRGIAALAVCFTHARYYYLSSHRIKLQADSFHHIGEQAVLAFYTLSAFLLSYRFLIDWQKLKNWKSTNQVSGIVNFKWELYELAKFFIRRVFRIYPAYFTTLLFIASNDITRKSYEWGAKDLFWGHFTMRHTKHNLWTVPVEFGVFAI